MFFSQTQKENPVQVNVTVFGDSVASYVTDVITGNHSLEKEIKDRIDVTIENVKFHFYVPNNSQSKGQQERYFQETNIVILCFSAINPQSFSNLAALHDQVKTHAPNAKFILFCIDPEQIGCGNAVSAKKIEEFRETHEIEYYRANSLNKEPQIQELINLLLIMARKLVGAAKEQPADPRPLEVQAPDEERHEEPKGCCTLL